MSVRYHFRDYNRVQSVRRLEAGQSFTTVAAAMGVSKSVISRFKKVAKGVNALRKHAGSRGRNTTPFKERYVTFVAKKNRNFNPGQIATYVATAISTHVSARTISRRLFLRLTFNLYARKPVRCNSLQPHHRRKRLRRCKDMLVRITKIALEGYSPANIFSVQQVILFTNYCVESVEHIMYKRLFVNMIGTAQV
ncbi:hypothetical protein TNCV_617641 [Trichonephila clavipes]|nr:hypothetical protein TNCV_617641 [Trichonephila clavipes]